MVALDHYHYARWMTVHVRDLLALEANCPTTHAQFIKGNFVTQKTTHHFSTLAHDQVHEQLNAMAKGDGGVIGITETAPRRWMVAGPETILRRWKVAGPETALRRWVVPWSEIAPRRWMVAGPETALRRWMVAGPETSLRRLHGPKQHRDGG